MGISAGRGRPRSLSHTSVVSYASAASSLAQTVTWLFQEDEDIDVDGWWMELYSMNQKGGGVEGTDSVAYYVGTHPTDASTT
jgi:hypothetical protein